MGLLRLSHVRPEATPEMTVAEVVRVMTEAEIGAIAVLDDGKLAGIFTERI
jgi:CBS domain-containing protein